MCITDLRLTWALRQEIADERHSLHIGAEFPSQVCGWAGEDGIPLASAVRHREGRRNLVERCFAGAKISIPLGPRGAFSRSRTRLGLTTSTSLVNPQWKPTNNIRHSHTFRNGFDPESGAASPRSLPPPPPPPPLVTRGLRSHDSRDRVRHGKSLRSPDFPW